MITKVLQDLEVKENIVGQVKSNIKNLDRRITETQNPSTCLPDIPYTRFPDVPYTNSAVVARSDTTAVQAQTL